MSRERALDLSRLALLLVVAVALQSALVSQLPFLGSKADLFLILVVLIALRRGSLTGVVFGFIVGLLADIFYFDPLGLRALLYLVAGFAVGRYEERLELGNAWAIVLITACVSFGSQMAYGLFQYVIVPGGSFFLMLRSQMLPAAVIDGLLAAPLYIGLMRFKIIRAPHGGAGLHRPS